MTFTHVQKVLFRHCDPAGIVFYPRYFEMLNDAVEAYFETALGWPFERLHPSSAVPTAQLKIRFTAPSRHGDKLRFLLSCVRLGQASLGLAFEVRCDGELRVVGETTLVLVDAAGKPQAWPERVRQAISIDMGGSDDGA